MNPLASGLVYMVMAILIHRKFIIDYMLVPESYGEALNKSQMNNSRTKAMYSVPKDRRFKETEKSLT